MKNVLWTPHLNALPSKEVSFEIDLSSMPGRDVEGDFKIAVLITTKAILKAIDLTISSRWK